MSIEENNLSESYNNLVKALNDFEINNINQKDLNDKFQEILKVVEEIKTETKQSINTTLELTKELDKSIKSTINENSISTKEMADLVGNSKQTFEDLVVKMETVIKIAQERDTVLIDKLRDEVKENKVKLDEIKSLLNQIDKFNKASRSEKRVLKKKS